MYLDIRLFLHLNLVQDPGWEYPTWPAARIWFFKPGVNNSFSRTVRRSLKYVSWISFCINWKNSLNMICLLVSNILTLLYSFNAFWLSLILSNSFYLFPFILTLSTSSLFILTLSNSSLFILTLSNSPLFIRTLS